MGNSPMPQSGRSFVVGTGRAHETGRGRHAAYCSREGGSIGVGADPPPDDATAFELIDVESSMVTTGEVMTAYLPSLWTNSRRSSVPEKIPCWSWGDVLGLSSILLLRNPTTAWVSRSLACRKRRSCLSIRINVAQQSSERQVRRLNNRTSCPLVDTGICQKRWFTARLCREGLARSQAPSLLPLVSRSSCSSVVSRVRQPQSDRLFGLGSLFWLS